MKKIKCVILSGFLLLAGVTVRAQMIQPDTLNNRANKPHVEIKVKKAYDKNGNIIRYDSTYVWTYNNHSGNVHINPDSLMSKFMPFFRKNLPDSLLQIFGNPDINMNDSAMMKDFFNNAHFFDQWQQGLFNMKKEMQAMDALRMEFLKRYLHEYKRGNKKNPVKAGIY